MQKATQVNQEYTLLPVPTEVLEEVGIDAFSTVQFSVARGNPIIEPIDAEQNMVCIGSCCRCPGRFTCEGAPR